MELSALETEPARWCLHPEDVRHTLLRAGASAGDHTCVVTFPTGSLNFMVSMEGFPRTSFPGCVQARELQEEAQVSARVSAETPHEGSL